MNTLLTLISPFIMFGPIAALLLRTRQFNRRSGAISDLNNFPRSRNKFIVLMGLYITTQILFIHSLSPTAENIPPLIFSLILGLVALPFSSHSVRHIFLISLSFAIQFIVMFQISSLIPAAVLATTTTLGIILGVVIIRSLIWKKPCPYFWIWEFLLFGFLGIWNITTLLT